MMIIRGSVNEYRVKWQPAGFSYAVPVVRIKKKIPFLPMSRWIKVWEGGAKPYLSAEKALPDEIREWFKGAVNEYEQYEEKWLEESKTI